MRRSPDALYVAAFAAVLALLCAGSMLDYRDKAARCPVDVILLGNQWVCPADFGARGRAE